MPLDPNISERMSGYIREDHYAQLNMGTINVLRNVVYIRQAQSSSTVNVTQTFVTCIRSGVNILGWHSQAKRKPSPSVLEVLHSAFKNCL